MNLTGWPELSTADLDTPVLVVDRRRLEANLIAMSSATTRHDVRLRPHVKTHKSVTIAQMQIEHGATGLTVATVGEAETFCAAGFTDLFIAYPVRASPAKAGRLHDVARAASLRVGVDSVSSAVLLAQQLADSVELVIEVDSGGHRTGVSTPEEACEIADAARAHGGNVVGVFTHGGHSYARPGIADAVATQEVAALTEAASALDAAGHEISVLSAGSTPTAVAAAGSPVTEVRPGTYVFQDRLQVHLGTCSDGEVSLRVASTVVSRNRDHAVLDAGAKTLSKDVPAGLTGHGSIIEHPTLSITTLYDHHAIVTGPASDLPDLGDVVWIVPNHVCPVVDLSPDLLAIGADGTQERGPSMPGAAPGDSRNNPDATHPNHESRRTPMPLIRMFVNGQAMTGGSLHHALKDATFLGPARTAPAYRFYSFHDVFPGLQPVSEGGFAVPGELYELTYEMLRTELLPKEPAELELTIIELDDGSGSLCMKVREGSTDAEGVVDISARGGWHQHLEQPS